MMTLGELLRKSREEKGLTLAEAAYQTKIRDYYLEALENNQLEDLPSVVQGKGYLRLYAQFLDLNKEVVFAAWSHPEHLIIEQIVPTPGENEEPQNESSLSETDKPEPKETSEKIPSHSVKELDKSEPDEKIIHGEKISEEEIQDENLVSISKTPLSDKVFVSIGKQLKSQRDQLNLSLSEIEKFTNIRTYYLEALENGKLEKLPSIPQARGMLSNFASFLNLDLDKIMIDFAEGLQTRRNENYAPQKIGSDNQLAYQAPEVKKVGWLKFITVDMILTSVLIIGLFIFIIWGAANISGLQGQNEEIDAPSISEILLEETPQISNEESTAIVEVEITDTVNENLTTDEPGITNPEDEEINDEVGPSLSGDPVQVYIIARQRAYLKVDVDGETVFNGRVIPGNAYEYSGSSSVEILTGNAAALEIFYNLNPIGAIGEVGEVKSLLFTSGTGMTSPTPRFSPSPTNTVQATTTPRPTATPTIAPPTPTPTVTQLIP
jgi:cytoskeletal protein RodZ